MSVRVIRNPSRLTELQPSAKYHAAVQGTLRQQGEPSNADDERSSGPRRGHREVEEHVKRPGQNDVPQRFVRILFVTTRVLGTAETSQGHEDWRTYETHASWRDLRPHNCMRQKRSTLCETNRLLGK